MKKPTYTKSSFTGKRRVVAAVSCGAVAVSVLASLGLLITALATLGRGDAEQIYNLILILCIANFLLVSLALVGIALSVRGQRKEAEAAALQEIDRILEQEAPEHEEQ